MYTILRPFKIAHALTLWLLLSTISLSSGVLAQSSGLLAQSETSLDSQTPKKILVVGDSLSAAYKLAAEQGWVHLLQQRLNDNGYRYNVVNASVSGATTAAGMAIMPEALRVHQPDIVLLELGANDGLQGKPVPYITQSLNRLIVMAKESGAQVVLIGIHLPPNFGSRYTQPFFDQYETLAKKHTLPLVPFLLDKVAGHPDLMQRDGLHPRAEGQPIVLDNVWPVLKPIL